MPVPVSSTTSVRTPLSYSLIKETPPSSVNLTAFDSRLFPICIIRSLSVNTMASCPVFTDKDSPLFTATGMNSVSSVCVIAEIRQGDRRGCSLPLSRRKKSSKVLSISRIRSEDCSMFWIYCPDLSSHCSFRISPALPVIAVSGVRSSWVIVCTAFFLDVISASFRCTDCSSCLIKSVVLCLYCLMLFASRCMMM